MSAHPVPALSDIEVIHPYLSFFPSSIHHQHIYLFIMHLSTFMLSIPLMHPLSYHSIPFIHLSSCCPSSFIHPSTIAPSHRSNHLHAVLLRSSHPHSIHHVFIDQSTVMFFPLHTSTRLMVTPALAPINPPSCSSLSAHRRVLWRHHSLHQSTHLHVLLSPHVDAAHCLARSCTNQSTFMFLPLHTWTRRMISTTLAPFHPSAHRISLPLPLATHLMSRLFFHPST